MIAKCIREIRIGIGDLPQGGQRDASQLAVVACGCPGVICELIAGAIRELYALDYSDRPRILGDSRLAEIGADIDRLCRDLDLRRGALRV